MIKLDTLSRWTPLAKGQVLALPGRGHRNIRLNVNSPGRACLYVVNDDGEMQFLAAPVGRETVQFTAPGDVRITTDADDVTVYTAETEPTCVVIEDPEVFTTIAERTARNPDLEYMMHLQQQNIERRMAALSAEMERKVANAYEAGRSSVPAPAPVEPVVVTEPEPDGSGSPPPTDDGSNPSA